MKTKFWDILDSIIDAIKLMVTKAASRTFMAWVVATHMTYIQLLEADNWMIITMLFLGLRTALDWKGMNIETLKLHYNEEKIPNQNT